MPVRFYGAGKVPGVFPFEDTELNINGNLYNFQGGYGNLADCTYTICFNQKGEIDRGTLADGEDIHCVE